MSDVNPVRDGDMLVVHDGTTLPTRCPVCNAAASGGPVALSFGSLMSEETTVVVRVFLCDEHSARFRRLKTYGWASMLSGIGGLLIAAALRIDSTISSIIAVVSLTAVMIGVGMRGGMAFGIMQTFIQGRRYEDGVVWLDGMCPEFLAAFPDLKRADVPSET
jgi:hypothetical protein